MSGFLTPEQEARIREIVANAIEDWELHRVGPPLDDSASYREGLREAISTALRRGDERRGR